MTTAQHSSRGPVLAVYAHPDDETLQVGGVLALAAEQGRQVIVVTATRGERGEMIGSPELEGTAEVASVRETECREALSALGVTEHYWLDQLDGADQSGWTDSGMVWLAPGEAGPAPDSPVTALSRGDLESQARALATLIRRIRPAVVLCDEPGGAYGHPDHLRTHDITVAAVSLAASHEGDDAWQVPALAWAVQDAQRLLAAREAVSDALAELHPAAVTSASQHDPNPRVLAPPITELPSIARHADQVDLEIDVRPVLPRVLRALRDYHSQVMGAQIPMLDAARDQQAAARRLDTRDAAVGWYALSDGDAQPILPVVQLQVGRGSPDAIGMGGVSQEDAEVKPPVATSRILLAGAVGLGMGALAGTIGTLVARVRPWDIPVGMLLAAALVTIGGLLARAAFKGGGLAGFGLGVLATVQVFALVTHDGNDVLIPGDTLGSAWLLVSMVAVAVAAFAPRRWVGERR